MAPQLYMSVYKEQFTSHSGASRASLRPTSAHRRNNPQPRPDFLFPRSLQPGSRSLTLSRSRLLPPPPPVDGSRPLFPPLGHLSFHSPLTTLPLDDDQKPAEEEEENPLHMPPVSKAADQTLPSAGRPLKVPFAEASSSTAAQALAALRDPQRRLDYQRSAPLTQQLRLHAGAPLRPRPQTSLPSAPRRHHAARPQYYRSPSNSSLDYSRGYSCFQVVKPFQAGHYTIHPEFVSECLS